MAQCLWFGDTRCDVTPAGKHCMHVPPLICEPHAFSLGKAMPWYTSKALLSESVLSHRVVCDTALWGPTSISGADCLGPAPLDGLGFWQGTSTIVFLWCKQPKIYYALGRYSVCECMDTYWVHIKQRSDLERKLTGLRAEAWLPQWNRSKTLWVWAKSLQMNSPLFIYLFFFLMQRQFVSLEANNPQETLHQSNEEERKSREKKNNFHSEGVYQLKHIITDAKSPALDI